MIQHTLVIMLVFIFMRFSCHSDFNALSLISTSVVENSMTSFLFDILLENNIFFCVLTNCVCFRTVEGGISSCLDALN